MLSSKISRFEILNAGSVDYFCHSKMYQSRPICRMFEI